MSGILLTTTQHFPQVIFEGIAGNSFTGDIAIDSVEINSGNCPGKRKSICIQCFFSLETGSFAWKFTFPCALVPVAPLTKFPLTVTIETACGP